jgi:hypothetical protein
MKNVLFIEKAADLKFWQPKFRRLYFGAEFCQRLIPSPRQLKKVLQFCRVKNIEFSLVTPLVTNEGLTKLKSLFKIISQFEGEKEVVVNDWGLLRFLTNNYPIFSLVLGRLLNKQKRDPRIKQFWPKWPREAKKYFKLALGESLFTTGLFKSFKLNRIELDNLLQGIKRQNFQPKASLYYPFVYLSTTRYCLTAMAFSQESFKRKTSFFCNKDCRKHRFFFTSEDMPVKIYLIGNTQFIKNEKLPNNQKLKSLNIDRLVYKPENVIC